MLPGLAIWAADGTYEFSGGGFRHWLFIKGSTIDRLGFVAKTAEPVSYVVRPGEGTDPGARFVVYESGAMPETIGGLTLFPEAALDVREGQPGPLGEREAKGSGVLVTSTGYVLTNFHVIDGATKISVRTYDHREFEGKIIGRDEDTDLAVLKITSSEPLPFARFGDSDRLRVGDWVLAVGSPFGLEQTVTAGIISAKGRETDGGATAFQQFLQTDAAINPGSSGGPLVDLDGKVVGINTAIASQNGNNTGVSFSIPANLVKRVAGQLFEKGVVTRGYLGVQLAATIDPAEALRVGLTRVCGGLVEIVHPNTPAAAAGLRVGDVVLKLEDVQLRDEHHLINLISALPPGQRVRLTVWRDRRATPTDVTIGNWAAAKAAAKP